MRPRLLAAALVAATAVAAAPALERTALADWSVQRNPFDQRIVGRYKALLKRRPNDGYALARLLKLYRRHSSIGALIKEYRVKARKAPGSFAYQVILGHLYRITGNLARATQHYERAGKLRPKSSTVPAALAKLYRKQDKVDKAIAAYKRALSLARTTRGKKRYLRALANIALAKRDLKGARQYYARLVKLDPRNIFVRIELAQALARSKSYKEAIAEYEKILKRTSQSSTRADVLKQIGGLYTKLGKTDKAVATYRKAMRLAARGHWIRRELTDRIISIYREKDDLKSLIAHYEKTWKNRGHFEWQVLGRLYDETGDEGRALKAYRAALKRNRHAIDTRVRLIALLERAGRAKEVISEYRTLAKIAPGEPRYQLELAKRLYRAGKQNEAIAVLERLGARFRRDASVHSALADLFARWGDQKRAMREAKILVSIEPKDDSHLVNLGEQYWLRGKKRLAVATWRRLLGAIAKKHRAYAKLAEILGQHDLTKEAIKLYRKAIKLKKDHLPYRRSLALLLEHKKMNKPALDAWDKVLVLAKAQKKRRQSLREARSHIINILHRTYRLRTRIRRFRLAFEATPPDLESGFFLAEAYLKRRNLERAAVVYRKILAFKADNLEAMVALEAVYRRQRKLNEAVKLLKRLAELQPHNKRDYYQRIANLLLQVYRDKEATEYMHKAVALGSQDARSYQRLGELYERKEDPAGAVKAYKKALELNPNLHAVHFALARLYTRSGENAKAEKLYRLILKKARTPEILRKAFRLGVDISAYLGKLEKMEKEIQPLAVSAARGSEVYRRILVDIYRRRVPPLVHQARHGDAATRKAAQETLKKIGLRGMTPLLERLATTAAGSTTRRQLIRLLGYLGNPNAALPLLRLAQRDADERPIVIRGRHYYRYSYYYRSRYGYRRRAEQLNERVEAVVAVGRLADERAVKGLVALMGSTEGNLREAAAWALTRAGGRKSIKALFNGLGDNRTGVQVFSCVGLGLHGGRRMRAVLEEVMLDDTRRQRVRAACAYGLGLIGDAHSVPTLLSVVRSGDDTLQRNAAWALGAIADKRAVKTLVRVMWNKRPVVRRAIAWALVRISDKSSIKLTRRSPDVVVKSGHVNSQAFVNVLTRGVDELKGKALAVRLSKLIGANETAIAEGLRTALGRHRDVVLRSVRDLDQRDLALSLGPLTAGAHLLRGNDKARMDRAIKAVVDHVKPQIAALIGSHDPLVRRHVLSVYSKLAGSSDDLAGVLTKGLDDEDWSVRVAAMRAAVVGHRRGALQASKLVTLASGRLKSSHWRVREAAVAALGAVGSASATPALAQALADNNGFVREAAAKALGRSGGAAARSPLVKALRDEVPHVRAAACASLAQLKLASGERGSIEPLLRDESPLVSGACKAALGR
ncbi:MAG: HEAT repeat domain-containing protein [Myxococcales bacterium]|nr:HEAT repeat domain-containing protein [Myxococcales bacterium]